MTDFSPFQKPYLRGFFLVENLMQEKGLVPCSRQTRTIQQVFKTIELSATIV